LSLAGPSFQLHSTASVFSTLEVSVYFSLFSYFSYKMLVAILQEMDASVYFIFGIFISIYFFHDLYHAIIGKMHIFFVFDIWVQTCRNLDVENKKWDIGEGTYLVVENSENGEKYSISAS